MVSWMAVLSTEAAESIIKGCASQVQLFATQVLARVLIEYLRTR